jgi:hypothetical protein
MNNSRTTLTMISEEKGEYWRHKLGWRHSVKTGSKCVGVTVVTDSICLGEESRALVL